MPNVLLYMSDEHNPFYSSVYGHPLARTPQVEQLAERGTLFRNAYCPSPLCLPCRAAFMAGMPVHRTQVYNNSNAIQFDYPSYGARLSAQGVHTVYAGKTDVYHDSPTLGFDELILPRDRRPPGDVNFSRRPLAIREGAAKRADGFGPKENPYGGDTQVIDAAVDWLHGTAPALSQPWTFTVNTVNPHFPHYTTHALWDSYAAGGDLPEHGLEAASAQHPYAADLRAHFQTEAFTDEQTRGLRRGYYGCIDFVDSCLGRLLDTLDQTGLADDTVVVYCSDHGEMLGKFGMWWKCSLFEPSARVPLIVAGPGFDRGTVTETPVNLLDLHATLYAATGASAPDESWGTALQAIPRQDADRVVCSEYHGHGTRSGAFLVRQGEWKLIYNLAAEHQLFDLAHDPDELNNQAAARPEKVAELTARLRDWCDPERENDRAHAQEARLHEAVARLAR